MNYANVAKKVPLLKTVRLIPNVILKIGIYYTENVTVLLIALRSQVHLEFNSFIREKLTTGLQKEIYLFASEIEIRGASRKPYTSYTFPHISSFFFFFHN